MKTPRRKVTGFFCRIFLSFTALCSFTVNCRAADELERVLLREAAGWITTLQSRDVANVGVLKFRVKHGDAPASDRVGELNYRLSEKIERALIVRNPVSKPMGIIRNANLVAATITGASHLTADGRARLLKAEYPLAWGGNKVTPDAFLTGTAALSADMSKMTVMVAWFGTSQNALEKLAQFEVPLDIEDLVESGASFSVRGLFDDGAIEKPAEDRKEQASAVAARVAGRVLEETTEGTPAQTSALHPLSPANTNSPVSLEIRYDGRPQKLEFRDGFAFIAEPRENQQVSLIVRRNGSDRRRLGVVVKVNGENTLYRQTLPDSQCSPWVFEPRLTEFGITGYQMNQQTKESFKVLSDIESSAREINYGALAGTISISVFPERLTTPVVSPAELTSEDGEDFALMTRAIFPSAPPANFAALKAQLYTSANRGLITDGATVTERVEITEFKGDALPEMSATIRYYVSRR
jgi:hypothetical protein